MGFPRGRHGLISALTAGLMLLLCPPAGSETIHVPGHHATIQAAIDAAEHGDTIVISPGTWTGPGNRDLDPLGKAIVIRSANGPQSCIIDCQNLGRGFSFHSCESNITTVMGLTIRGGLGESGGGIHGYWSSPTIVDCVIADCRATGAGGGIGGIYFSPVILDCRFEGNLAMDGGGLCFDQSPEVRLVRCSISDNEANRSGGGLCCRQGSTPQIFNCTFSSNKGLLGGGAASENAETTLRGCRFENNQAWDGGGVYCSGPQGPRLLDTIFTLNKAAYGGAVCGSHGPLELTNCLLAENRATISGGALHGWQLATTITGSTLSGNLVLEGRGGGISTCSSRLVITDCILWGDRPDEILAVTGAEPLVTFSNVEGGHPGEGNLDTDPLFTCAPCGTHCLCQLAAGEPSQSPCIDAGSRPAQVPRSRYDGWGTWSAGTITRSDWVADSGRLDLGYHHRLDTIHARLDCIPSFGWLPFPASFAVTLGNRTAGTRRIAARVEAVTPGGTSYPNWRAGWADVPPGKVTARQWSLTLPANPSLAGVITLELTAQDVTPPPWNLPPHPPSGHRTGHSKSLMAALPPR